MNAGHSLYEAQKKLGHRDPRTTMRYAHLGQASLLAAAETVSGFFFLPAGGNPFLGKAHTAHIWNRREGIGQRVP